MAGLFSNLWHIFLNISHHREEYSNSGSDGDEWDEWDGDEVDAKDNWFTVLFESFGQGSRSPGAMTTGIQQLEITAGF